MGDVNTDRWGGAQRIVIVLIVSVIVAVTTWPHVTVCK